MNDPGIVADNQLVRLFRLAHRQQENYTTEAFAHVLRYLIAHEASIAAEALDWLTGTEAFSTAGVASDSLAVETQCHSEDCGIPDVRIQSDSLDVIIEVKLDASLRQEQLCAYWPLLVRGGKPTKALIGLTGAPPEIPTSAACEAAGVVGHPVLRTWVGLAAELRRCLADSASPLTRHVVEQILGLLNYLGLTPMRIESELSSEVEAHRLWSAANPERDSLFNSRVSSIRRLQAMEHTWRLRNLLLLMERVARQSAGVRSCRLDSGTSRVWPWIGFNINGMKYFFYLSLQHPETVLVQRFDTEIDPGSFDRSLGALERSESSGTRWRVGFDLLDPSVGFLDLNEAGQEACLQDFFNRAFKYAEGLRPVGAVTSPDGLTAPFGSV